ncbi:IPT/TIG domain-containing protein [Alistipes sp.]|uniref:IPT/TIG domain-containing protein n=1 Tax=Alistipes sp. TaxID=1872444 RepID=UPI003AF0EF08
MNLKIKRFPILAALAVGAALLAGGCDDRGGFIDASDARHIPAVNPATLSPLSNESGSVKAYVGTEVTAEGFNLDRVGAVTMDDQPTELTGQTIKQIKFRIPALDYAQNDLPYAVKLKVFDLDGAVIFDYDYFVTIPVTDALISGYEPKEGCVGDEVTLTGRNLEQITRVHFGTQTVEAADFTEHAAATVKFLVPAGDYTPGDNAVAIAAEWGTNRIDVTGDEPFTLHIPRFDALQAQTQPAVLGDELTLTGANLDRITAVLWGEEELSIVAQSAEAMTVRFPATIEEATPAVQTRALTARYGEPAQSVTLAAAWQLDTTHSQEVLIPAATSMTAEDGGADNRFYLAKTVTVAGENLTAVEAIELRYNDGEERRVAAALAGDASDAQLRFVVPDGVTFSEATVVNVAAIYNGGDAADFGTAKVYPFYCYKDLRIGLGSNSKSTYPDFNREHAFFLPDDGEVISADAWYENGIDPYAKSGSNSLIAGAQKLAAGTDAASYYGVKPYLFFSASSSNKLALNSPANSSSQLKNHFYGDSKTALPSAYGTPIFYFRVMTDDDALKAAIADGSVESVTGYGKPGGSAAPAMAAAESSSAWIAGSVIVVQYINHAHGLAGGKPASAEDVRRQGFLYVREVTCADPATGQAVADRSGHIRFDFYWSKTINE